ncbi:MAG: hypothetical protein V1891_02435 [bacterium]
MQTFILSIIIIISLIVGITTAVAAKSFAPWLPCRNKDLERIFKIADLKNNEIFYDLGCGDGKTIIYANKHYKAKAIGLELSLPLFLICKIRQFFNNDMNIIFKWKNFFNENISKADVIYFFGVPSTIKTKLKTKIEKEAKTGARVISYVFKVEGWKPIIADKPTDKDLAIYMYKR